MKICKAVLKWLNQYFIFFFLVAFVITCCTMLFVSLLSDTLDIVLTADNIGVAAKITFLNVALLSLIFTVIDTIRRKLTVERPVNEIVRAAEKIVKGDFTVRIKQQSKLGADESFNRIIDCFNKMAEELGSVETLRADFVSSVSHEMKTPLAVMSNYGILLQAPGLTEEKRLEYAKGVNDAARRTSEMMTNILKLNNLENQKIFAAIDEYDLGEQLCECLLQYESVWEQKGIEIETDIAEDITVRSDAKLLMLVWNNLFSNAFKFTREGGKISVCLSATEHHATVTVRDTGCGMTPEVGAHIFDKFYQGDPSRATEGNGLGLALVKKVIDIVKGEISVESKVGKGSTFTVRIRR